MINKDMFHLNKHKVNLLNGFSLIEFLIVSLILGIIGTVVISILFISLRVSKKADNIDELRSVGDAVVSQVIKNIRFSDGLDFPSSCVGGVNSSYVQVVDSLNNQQNIFSCDVDASGTSINWNGDTLLDKSRYGISDCKFYCIQSSTDSPPILNFSFSIYQKSNSGLVENRASIPFSTSVTLRNFNN